MSFSYHIEELNGSVVFQLNGKLTNESDAIQLNDQVDMEVKSGNRRLLFDLENLTYCNSSGLNVFIRSLTKTRTAGGDTAICAVNTELNNLFHIAKVNDIFSIFSTKEEGLKHFNAIK